MEFGKLGKEGKFQSAIYHRFIQNIVSVSYLLESKGAILQYL